MERVQPLRPQAFSQPEHFSLDNLSAPFVVDGSVEQWPARQWTVDALAQVLGNRLLRCRLMQADLEKREGPAWEAEGVYVECQLQHFGAWCHGEAMAEDNPLSPFSPRLFSAYIDYKYMRDVFADQPHMLKDVQWSTLGLTERDGKDSTLWIGSGGASTPCHYDTYGFNLVAQIQGRKRWVLFPPEQSCHLYPTRVPYEESSVFSQVDLAEPDLQRFPRFKKATPVVITLEAGQVLYVPRHWWHYVTCEETAISINTWVEMPEDEESRTQEAVTRLLASALIPYLGQSAGPQLEDFWLNPTEELEEAACNVQYLKAALSSVTPSPCANATETRQNSNFQTDSSHHCRGELSTQQPMLEENDRQTPSEVTIKECGTCSSASESEHLSRQKQNQISTLAAKETAACCCVTESDYLPCQNEEQILSKLTTKETTCSCGASQSASLNFQSTDKERNRQTSTHVEKRRQKSVGLELSEESKESHIPSDSVFTPTGLLSQVGKTLEGSTVVTVDSPFCLSQFLTKTQQAAASCSVKHCSVTQREKPDTHASSLKRKHVESEHDQTLDIQQKDAALGHMSDSLCNADADIIIHSDFAQKQKRVCVRETKQFTEVTHSHQVERATPQSENITKSSHAETTNTQVSSESLCLCSITSGSLMSIYVPRPCPLQQYIKLLQAKDMTDLCSEKDMEKDEEEKEMSADSCQVLRDMEKDEEEKEMSADSCQVLRDQTDSVIEEVVLRSVLHPDVVKLIVSKLKEQV